jgi:pseudouridine synthase
MIRQGRVTVNGQLITVMGVKVEPEDVVEVDGTRIEGAKPTYILMNKPTGYLTTMSDPHRRPTVVKLLPRLDVTVKPCGRLDQDTEGLLIFTNDGLLAQRLTHPRYGVEKEYLATVEGVPGPAALTALAEGVHIEGGKTAPAQVTVEHASDAKNETYLRLVIHEGRKRQVRQMCEAVGHPVKTLRRVRIGPITLHKLPRGACRLLSVVEVESLKKLVGLSGGPDTAPRGRRQASRAPKPRFQGPRKTRTPGAKRARG